MDVFESSWLKNLDTDVLLAINGLSSPVADTIMWWVSDKWVWLPFYLLLTVMIVRRTGFARGLAAIIAVAVLVAAVDQTCASLIRPALMRMRPSNPDNPLSGMIRLVGGYRGGSYGFPSCHAANSFALTTFLSLLLRNRYATSVLLLWAGLVSYSRIYLGVHYPSDVVAGMLIGSVSALVTYRIYVCSAARISQTPGIMKKSVRLLRPRRFMVLAVIFLSWQPQLHSQDTLMAADSVSDIPKQADAKMENPYRFRPLQLIAPIALIGVGFVGLESDWLKGQNHETRDELQEHSPRRLSLDDFTQYAPLAATYGLKLLGVGSMHDYVDMTIIAGTAYLLTGLAVYGIKSATKVKRPDGSSRNSFPSGHTATAFAGAELLRREYWKVSPWIGVAGYVVAAGTGFFRMYNNRHWLTDVIAGAGIGILSAQAAYWLYPVVTKAFFRKRYKKNIFLSPYASRREGGFVCQITF